MDRFFNKTSLQYVPRTETPFLKPSTLSQNYPAAFNETNNSQLSIQGEPNIAYDLIDSYLNISSSNRDTTNYPLHYNYRINFDYAYRNVKKIELISAILPNQPAASSGGNILNESHLIIDIEELNYVEFPNNIGSAAALKAFAILPLKSATQASGGFINPELGCIYHKSKIFKTPLANLDHLTIRIRDYQGNLYDFGQTAGSSAKQYQNHFVLKITTEEKTRSTLNHRNVY